MNWLSAPLQTISLKSSSPFNFARTGKFRRPAQTSLPCRATRTRMLCMIVSGRATTNEKAISSPAPVSGFSAICARGCPTTPRPESRLRSRLATG